MGKKVKKILTNKIFTFILGGIIFSAVSVYAVTYFPSNQVTYDNGVSGLQSTDVQGALDELYNTCQSCSSATGNYIYFTDAGQNYLYRVSKNGGQATLLEVNLPNSAVNTRINNLVVTNDYIYFTDAAEQNYLYRVSKNGGRATLLKVNLPNSAVNTRINNFQVS